MVCIQILESKVYLVYTLLINYLFWALFNEQIMIVLSCFGADESHDDDDRERVKISRELNRMM
jgi:hypothetical protein